jgi:endo-1,4-beta-D-glucanase Y
MAGRAAHTARGETLIVAIVLGAALAAGTRPVYAQYCPAAVPWPLAPNDNNNTLLGEYSAWKSTYVVVAPTGMRVIRTENDNDTVSEGMGYGMILAAYLNDKPTLDALWAYVVDRIQAYPTGTGLMHWRFSATGQALHYDGTVLQQGDPRLGPASDADEDMALALIVAEKKWGGYQTDSVTLINNIMQWEVEPGTYVFKPGNWGGSDVLNPSYLAPGYYKVFKQYLADVGSLDTRGRTSPTRSTA